MYARHAVIWSNPDSADGSGTDGMAGIRASLQLSFRVPGVQDDRVQVELIGRDVAAGGSNKEVAAALFVTVNTVEAHLSRVYRKLGVRSRNQLAGALAEQGPGVSGLSATDRPA